MITNTLLIILFTLFTLFSLITISMIFFVIYNKKIEKNIVRNINEIKLYNFDQKIERLSIVADNQEKYETILNAAFSFKEYVLEFIETLKKYSYRLINFNKNYNIISGFILASKIKKETKYINKKIEEFDNILKLMYKNLDLISEIYMDDTMLFNQIADFYEKHLSNEYDNSQLFFCFEEIKNLLESLFKQKSKCEIPVVVDLQRKILKNMSNLSTLLMKIFIYNQILIYIRFNIKEISKLIVSGKITISSQDNKTIERNKSILEDLYNSLLSSIKSLNFSKVDVIIKEASKNINIINEKMNYSLQYDSMLIDSFKDALSTISLKNEELINYLRKVLQNFSSDIEVKESVMNCLESLNSITNVSKLINSEKSKNISGKDKISKIIECESHIKNLTSELLDMNYSISQKYNFFGKMINDISIFKASLANLNKMVNEIDKNNDILNEIQKKIKWLCDLEEKIDNDIYLLENENINDKLIEIKDWIINNTLIYSNYYKMKLISEKLLVLSYRFLGENKNDDALILKSEQLYKKSEYKKSIDILEKKLKIFRKLKEANNA